MSIETLVASVASRAFVEDAADSLEQTPSASSARIESEPIDTSKADASLSVATVSALGPELESANQRLSATGIRMSLGVDRESGRVVVTLIDEKTKDTVLQIPSDTVLNLDRRLEQLTGIILNRYG